MLLQFSLLVLALPPLSLAASPSSSFKRAKRLVTADGASLDGQTFDYVIVGGGVAGLVLANRLSADPGTTVAVLESGGDGADVQDRLLSPGMAYFNGLVGTNYDWAYATTNQSGLGDRIVSWPRGKILGGSGAINGLYLFPSDPADYDGWSKLVGSDAWGWPTTDASIRKTEQWTPIPVQQAAHLQAIDNAAAHGTNGSIHHSVAPVVYPEQLSSWLPSFASLGFPTRDPRAGPLAGPFFATSAIDPNGFTRSYGKTGYLDPIASRANLVVATGQTATRVLFSGGTATGVRFTGATATNYTVNARREVILSSGTIGSAHLLLVSGVGPAAQLTSAGIDVVRDLPGVGQHLHEHISSALTFDVTGKVGVTGDRIRSDADFAAAQLALWRAGNASSLYAAPNNAVAFLNLSTVLGTTDATTSFLSTAQAGLNDYAARFSDPTVRAGYTTVQGKELAEIYPSDVGTVEILLVNTGSFGAYAEGVETMRIQASLQRSFSRGSITVTSGDLAVPPVIDPGYFSHPADIQMLRESFKFIRRLAGTAPISTLINSELTPSSAITSDADLETFLRANAGTAYSPTGTCAMLPLELGGVVGPDLRVHGLSNLRVVDASVFPVPMAAHACSPTYALAETAAGIILGTLNVATPSSSSSTPITGPTGATGVNAAASTPASQKSGGSRAQTVSFGAVAVLVVGLAWRAC